MRSDKYPNQPQIFVVKEPDEKAGFSLDVLRLQLELESAAKKLTKVGAWPRHAKRVTIRIMNSHNVGFGMGVELQPDPDGFGVIQPKNIGEMEIWVSRKIFSEMPASLLNMGARREEVLLHFIGHEIHHLDEVERQSGCGILNNQQSAAFTQAIRSEFGSLWTTALKTFSARFPDVISEPSELREAGQIANEAAADLTGLYWMKRVMPKRVDRFAEILTDFREWNWKQAQGYSVHHELRSIIKTGLNDLPAIRLECLNLGAARALASGRLPTDIHDLFEVALSTPQAAATHGNIPKRAIGP